MLAGFLAAALAVSIQSRPPTIRVEAETGEMTGATVANARSGYSGSGYATGFTTEGAKVTCRFQASAGLYQVQIRYSAQSGKGYGLVVNGAGSDGFFDPSGEAFATHTGPKVELRDGENTVAILKGWGWFDVDYIEFAPSAPSPMPRKPPAKPCDAHATPEARALLAHLVRDYGAHTLSGQYGHDDCTHIRESTGKTPAILGDDFMDYSPSRVERGSMPKDTTERAIAAARAGQIVTFSWHWNAPKDLIDKEYKNERGETIDGRWYKGFYTNATTFDVKRALADPASEDYKLLLRDIDAIVVQLRKVADAKVPVLWRPLHEAEGGWFWWGAKGPETYIRLWKLLYDRLTKHHGLHNLLWVHNCANPKWYPGDDWVDIVGIDAYPYDQGDPLIGTWDSLSKWLDGKKLLAVTEFGGAPDVARMHRFGARWSYFVSWSGTTRNLPKEHLVRTYGSSVVGNR